MSKISKTKEFQKAAREKLKHQLNLAVNSKDSDSDDTLEKIDQNKAESRIKSQENKTEVNNEIVKPEIVELPTDDEHDKVILKEQQAQINNPTPTINQNNINTNNVSVEPPIINTNVIQSARDILNNLNINNNDVDSL